MNSSIVTIMNVEGDVQNHWSYFVALALEIVIAISVNAFIISVSLYDFAKAKTMSSVYKILLVLGIDNISFSILMSVCFVDFFCNLSILAMTDTIYIFLQLSLICISSCAWHAATLAFFYFIKVSDMKFSVFAWTKRKIRAIVPWMLLLSVFVSLLSSLFLISPREICSNSTEVNPSLLTALTQSMSSVVNDCITVTIAPLLVILITTTSTVASLKKHSHRMKSVQTSDGEHFKSYENVVSRMTRSLLFYVIFYAVLVIFYFAIIRQRESIFSLSLLMLASFSPVQSILLVLANPRLRAAWKEIVLCVLLQKMLRR